MIFSEEFECPDNEYLMTRTTSSYSHCIPNVLNYTWHKGVYLMNGAQETNMGGNKSLNNNFLFASNFYTLMRRFCKI